MKKTKSTLLALTAVLVSPMAANAGLMNGGFEDGNLNGYSVFASNANVVMSNTTSYSPGTWGADVTTSAIEGSYMLALSSGAANTWQTVSQTISLYSGAVLSGSAFFDWGDYWISNNFGGQYPDGAKVEILDSTGAVAATPWALDGTDFCVTFCQPATGQAGAESGWQDWSFTAGAAGDYTLQYAVKNTGDSGGPNQTFGYFDAAQVPEPGMLALFGIGLVGMGLTRRRRKV